jgi:hypothetical protein
VRGLQRGQAAVEFTLVAVLVVAALCLPWAGGEAPASRLLRALTASLQAFEYWISCC